MLDAGCGPGEPTGVALRDAGLHVIPLDRSAGQLALARRHHERCVRGDLCALALADVSVDAVVALYSCTHLPPDSQPGAIAEFARVTKPGGRLVVTLSASPVEHGDHDRWLGVDTYFGGLAPDANRAALEGAGWHITDDEIIMLAEPEVATQFHWLAAYRRH